jgi:hypothetical protein
VTGLFLIIPEEMLLSISVLSTQPLHRLLGMEDYPFLVIGFELE